jgi:hypothetical protein
MEPRKESIEATCPECRGPLSLVRADGLLEIRCLVGHLYSVKGVLRAHSDAQEKALWAAVVALREAENLVESVAGDLPTADLEELRAQVQKKFRQAAVVQQVIEELEPFAGQ